MIPRIHVVTNDEVLARDEFRRHAAAILDVGRGDIALHVRGPHTPAARVVEHARSLRGVAAASGGLVLVNDRVDVALVLHLPGVHLGSRSLPVLEVRKLLGSDSLIGVSAHDVEEAREAAERGADYVLAGTIFRSASHPDRRAAGLSFLRAVARGAGVPVLAIGGVGLERVDEIFKTGAHGFAMIGAVWDAPDPAGAVEAFRKKVPGATRN